MMLEKGFDLKSNDLTVVPILIRKKINALKWEQFCDARSLPDDELVREFYASLTTFIPISHSSTISMEQMLLLYEILTKTSINVGKIILKEIHDYTKKKAGSEQEEPTEPNLIRNRTFLNQGLSQKKNQSRILLRISLILLFLSSQMLSLRHGRKMLTMQAEMELKKTRGISQKN
ncbi:hypothetical protein Gotur_032423, partial [Gossypium turneri]